MRTFSKFPISKGVKITHYYIIVGALLGGHLHNSLDDKLTMIILIQSINSVSMN